MIGGERLADAARAQGAQITLDGLTGPGPVRARGDEEPA